MPRNLFENHEDVPAANGDTPEEEVPQLPLSGTPPVDPGSIDVEVAVEVPDEVLERLRSEKGFTTTAEALIEQRRRATRG